MGRRRDPPRVSSAPFQLSGVVIGGVLARFVGVMLGVRAVAMRYMGMVPGFFFVSGGMMLRRHAMVLRGTFMMFGCFQMVLFAFFRHG